MAVSLNTKKKTQHMKLVNHMLVNVLSASSQYLKQSYVILFPV